MSENRTYIVDFTDTAGRRRTVAIQSTLIDLHKDVHAKVVAANKLYVQNYDVKEIHEITPEKP